MAEAPPLVSLSRWRRVAPRCAASGGSPLGPAWRAWKLRSDLSASSAQAGRSGEAEKRKPFGRSTARAATSRAARWYRSTRPGVTGIASPTLAKPSPPTLSVGNSRTRVGRMSTPVRSRTALSYSVLLSRRSVTGPGSPARAAASASSAAATQPSSCSRSAWLGCGAFFGGISPSFNLSAISASTLGCAKIAFAVARLVMSRSLSLGSLPWHFPQVFTSNGWIRSA